MSRKVVRRKFSSKLVQWLAFGAQPVRPYCEDDDVPVMQTADRGLDQYDLDQLARVLKDSGESNGLEDDVTTSDSSSRQKPDLPLLLAPLSHSHPLLSSSQPFDVDAFLLSRPNTSLPDLRSELRGYLAQLKEELVQLINDDYAAFISLSTDLKGEGARLERLHWPLADVSKQIVLSRSELESVQDAVEAKLSERSAMREEKALLHLLLKLSDSVVRLETLLLISSPQESGGSLSSVDFAAVGMRDMNGLNLGLQLTVPGGDPKDDRSRGSQAKHLARVAAEYTQLFYHAEKARKEKCAFVEEMQWRIERIKTTLSRDLDHLFSNILTTFTSSSESATADRARLTTDLSECLKTYDILGGWRDAEEVIRRDVVRPFVKKTIYTGALTVPQTPLLPRTPFTARIVSPRSPYTPFTAMRSRQDSKAPLLLDEDAEDGSNELAALCNRILRFAQMDCKAIMELGERACSKSKGTQTSISPLIGGDNPEVQGPSVERFEIFANVLWAEIGTNLSEELGSVIFAVGRPDDFHKSYSTIQGFITALEQVAPSIHAIQNVRNHQTYTAFQRRWQLPVYFQLRWKEIVGKLEDVLSGGLNRGTMEKDFSSAQAFAVFEAFRSGWDPSVYIPELAHRFWRLSLQVLSRYHTFLEASLPAKPQPLKTAVSNIVEKTPTSSPISTSGSRIGTPAPQTETAETAAADELASKRLAQSFMDIECLQRHILKLWNEEIGILLPENFQADDAQSPEEILKDSLLPLTSLLPEIAGHIIAILLRRCSGALSEVRLIPSQFRATSRRREPTEPSTFVPGILRPVRQFFDNDDLGGKLKEKYSKEWSTEIFDTVASRYTTYLEGMKKTEDSLRKFKKGKAFSLFGVSSSKDSEEGKDDERLRVQMILDVEALGRDAQRLGVDIQSNKAYATLLSTATQDS